MAQLQFFGNFNSFIPEATGQIISFIRDPKNYRLNNYCQMVQSKKSVGVYKRIGLDQPVRSLGTDTNIWVNGKKRPPMHENQLKFDDIEFQCIRRNEGTTIGWETIEQADAKILTMYSAMCQNQLMTKRTQRVITLLETTSNWTTNNVDTANNLNGGAGFWDTAQSDPQDSKFLAIKKTLDTVAIRVKLLTNGMVDNNDKSTLKLIISPGAAVKMSQSPEIHAYLKESPYSLDQIKGRTPGQNAMWGLPDRMYGWDIEVEDAPIVTQNDVAAETWGAEASIAGPNATRKFVKSDNSAIVVSRVGGLDGQYGAPSFSTVQIYYKDKEIDVETFDDPKHRLTEVHVSENVKEVLAAPISGFLINNIFSA